MRHSWLEVHQRARAIAGGLAAAGVGPGDSVAVLAGAPVEIAPTAQGIWMRGASVTMLHQPTPRTDLEHWAADTSNVIDMIDARAGVESDPFLPVGVQRSTTTRRAADPPGPRHHRVAGPRRRRHGPVGTEQVVGDLVGPDQQRPAVDPELGEAPAIGSVDVQGDAVVGELLECGHPAIVAHRAPA